MTGEHRKQDNEQPCVYYSSLNIIRVIKERAIKWTGHVACIGLGEKTDGK